MSRLPALLLACFACASATPAQQRWSPYRPLQRPSVPAIDSPWVRSPVDAFVLRGLRARGLAPAPPASRVAWIRRATYDLTGLPPTPAEIAAFVADERPDAFERVVERLLASKQYGVKWGRHWLDLVRFAETDSYERDRRKPAAWRYRDWVVDSFNADKPYDRFVLEQLAGDEIDRPTLATIVATGYYRLGIWDDEPTDTKQAVYDDLDGILDTTTRVMLGVSMGCARCHDHKRDPIPQADYYRMLAFFEGIKPYKVGGGNATTRGNYVRRVPKDLGSADWEGKLVEWRRTCTELVREAKNLAGEAWSRLEGPARAAIASERKRGLVTHLTFDDPTDLGCEVSGAFLDEDGREGRALALDGKDDYAKLARPVADDFTIALWFKADRPGRGRATDLRWFLGSGLVDGEIRGIVDDFGVSLVADHVCAGTGRPEKFLKSHGGLADGRWHHVAFTRQRNAGHIALYVDGVKVDEQFRAGRQPLTRPKHLMIGRMLPGRGTLDGAIDDVRIYDRALDPRAVLDLYHGGGFERGTSKAVADFVGKPEAARYEAAVARLAGMKRPRRDTVEVLCVQEAGTRVAPSFVQLRGNVHAKGERVEPAFPMIAGGGRPQIVPAADGRSSGRRLALAKWIVDPKNPLAARVLANRIWQFHFGRGIVRTPNDFGRLGRKPTHPELLDWLASEVVARGWSLKAMHRLIMSSSAYRMSSQADARALREDPTNDLFWRFDMRRLTAEEIRDSILAVTGRLNLEMGGPGVHPKMPEEVLATSSRPRQAWGSSSAEQAARRSIYIHVKRSLLMPLLTAFDLADTDSSCPVRFCTTQATQALTMLNSDFLGRQSAVFAARLRREATTDRARVALGLRLVTCREPRVDEVDEGLRFITSLRKDRVPAERALENYCLLLLNLNEFLFLD